MGYLSLQFVADSVPNPVSAHQFNGNNNTDQNNDNGNTNSIVSQISQNNGNDNQIHTFKGMTYGLDVNTWWLKAWPNTISDNITHDAGSIKSSCSNTGDITSLNQVSIVQFLCSLFCLLMSLSVCLQI